MHPIKEILKTRDWARRFIPATPSLKEKASWSTKEQRDEFLVAQLKNSILSDYHALSDSIGTPAARAYVLDEVIELVKYDHVYREIKFRAWDKKEKRYWTQEEMNAIGGFYYSYKVAEFDPEEFTLEQFTGLKDKNGKDAYEGDIIECDGKRAVIEWDVECAAFHVGKDDHRSSHLMGLNFGWEVIGNKWENPDLLKV